MTPTRLADYRPLLHPVAISGLQSRGHDVAQYIPHVTPGERNPKTYDGACETGRFARSRHGWLYGVPEYGFEFRLLDKDTIEQLPNDLDDLVGTTRPNQFRRNLALEEFLPRQQPNACFVRFVQIRQLIHDVFHGAGATPLEEAKMRAREYTYFSNKLGL